MDLVNNAIQQIPAGKTRKFAFDEGFESRLKAMETKIDAAFFEWTKSVDFKVMSVDTSNYKLRGEITVISKNIGDNDSIGTVWSDVVLSDYYQIFCSTDSSFDNYLLLIEVSDPDDPDFQFEILSQNAEGYKITPLLKKDQSIKMKFTLGNTPKEVFTKWNSLPETSLSFVFSCNTLADGSYPVSFKHTSTPFLVGPDRLQEDLEVRGNNTLAFILDKYEFPTTDVTYQYLGKLTDDPNDRTYKFVLKNNSATHVAIAPGSLLEGGIPILFNRVRTMNGIPQSEFFKFIDSKGNPKYGDHFEVDNDGNSINYGLSFRKDVPLLPEIETGRSVTKDGVTPISGPYKDYMFICDRNASAETASGNWQNDIPSDMFRISNNLYNDNGYTIAYTDNKATLYVEPIVVTYITANGEEPFTTPNPTLSDDLTYKYSDYQGYGIFRKDVGLQPLEELYFTLNFDVPSYGDGVIFNSHEAGIYHLYTFPVTSSSYIMQDIIQDQDSYTIPFNSSAETNDLCFFEINELSKHQKSALLFYSVSQIDNGSITVSVVNNSQNVGSGPWTGPDNDGKYDIFGIKGESKITIERVELINGNVVVGIYEGDVYYHASDVTQSPLGPGESATFKLTFSKITETVDYNLLYTPDSFKPDAIVDSTTYDTNIYFEIDKTIPFSMVYVKEAADMTYTVTQINNFALSITVTNESDRFGSGAWAGPDPDNQGKYDTFEIRKYTTSDDGTVDTDAVAVLSVDVTDGNVIASVNNDPDNNIQLNNGNVYYHASDTTQSPLGPGESATFLVKIDPLSEDGNYKLHYLPLHMLSSFNGTSQNSDIVINDVYEDLAETLEFSLTYTPSLFTFTQTDTNTNRYTLYLDLTVLDGKTIKRPISNSEIEEIQWSSAYTYSDDIEPSAYKYYDGIQFSLECDDATTFSYTSDIDFPFKGGVLVGAEKSLEDLGYPGLYAVDYLFGTQYGVNYSLDARTTHAAITATLPYTFYPAQMSTNPNVNPKLELFSVTFDSKPSGVKIVKETGDNGANARLLLSTNGTDSYYYEMNDIILI